MSTAIQCFGGAQSCSPLGRKIGVPYEFSRTSSGWQATALAPSAARFPVSEEQEYFASTGMALFSMPTLPGGEEDLYARERDGSFVDIGPQTPPSSGLLALALGDGASTEDLSHVVFESNPVWPFDQTTRTGGEAFSLYEYVGRGLSQPFLVGVSGGLGSTDLISKCETTLAKEGHGDLSGDGRVVFFIAHKCASGAGVNEKTAVPARELYARVDGELADAHTVGISQRSPSECTGACLTSRVGDATFLGASVDGSKAFFSSTQQLTDSATSGGEGDQNLYEYDFSAASGHNLIDVSAGSTSGRPRVQGTVGVSADGSHVYFVARSVLTSAANGQGQSAREGSNNLYVFERDANHPNSQVSFIVSLSASDSEEWGEDGYQHRANVTPDGRFLVFLSHAQLTPDDSSFSGADQVFRYDAQTGELVRISVGNDGFNDNGNRPVSTRCVGGETGCLEDARIVFSDASTSRRDQTMSDDGSYVFFQSPVALTPQALDNVQVGKDNEGNVVYAQNVYEWHAGHVFLISDGRDVTHDANPGELCLGSKSSVCLLGSDATGSNVFFSTADQLVPEDTDTQLDYYDARICTTADPCVKPAPPGLPPCLGEACHGTPAGTPLIPDVPSVTFNGRGNLTPPLPVAQTRKKTIKCAKGKKRSHGRVRPECVKKAKVKHKPARKAVRKKSGRL
jgi:hypothetical protein